MLNDYDLKISHPDTFKQLSVKDVLFLYYFCPQVEQQIQVFTNYNSIIFTFRGQRKLSHGEKSWVITDETAIFTRKSAYTQELTEVASWEVVAFYFKDEFLQKVFNEFRPHLSLKNLPPPPKDMLINLKVNETTRTFFYSIIPYFSQKQATQDQLLQLKFKELLLDIFTDPGNVHFLAYVNSIMDQHKPPLWEVMDSNFMYKLTVAEYARLAERSVSSFKREFQEYYHTTPGKWLTNKRLDYAKLLLETSRKAVSDIAYDSGFENVSHFSRIFKAEYGTSPSHYRTLAI